MSHIIYDCILYSILSTIAPNQSQDLVGKKETVKFGNEMKVILISLNFYEYEIVSPFQIVTAFVVATTNVI